MLGDAKSQSAQGDKRHKSSPSLPQKIQGNRRQRKKQDGYSEILQLNRPARIQPDVIDHPCGNDGHKCDNTDDGDGTQGSPQFDGKFRHAVRNAISHERDGAAQKQRHSISAKVEDSSLGVYATEQAKNANNEQECHIEHRPHDVSKRQAAALPPHAHGMENCQCGQSKRRNEKRYGIRRRSKLGHVTIRSRQGKETVNIILTRERVATTMPGTIGARDSGIDSRRCRH